MSPFPVVVWLCLLVISAVWCASGIYDAALDEDDPNLPDNEEFERNIDATRPSPDKIYIPLAIPPRRWKKRENISKELVKFFEAKWSRAVFEPACSGKQWTIVPIYYWPGDTITLRCRVCTMGLAYNGLPKRWVVVRDIPKFFQKLDYAFAQGGAEFSFVQNKMEIYTGEQSYFDKKHPDNVPLSFSYNANGDYRKIIEHRTPPVFIQNGVDLNMYNLNSGNQGVYACIDEKSDSDVYFVYVLMAMLPPVNIPDELTTPENQQNDDCAFKGRMFPSHNWKWHFVPYPIEKDKLTFFYNNFDIKKHVPEDARCDKSTCTVRLDGSKFIYEKKSPYLIEFRWDQWTKCHNNKRRRHCYLIRDESEILHEDCFKASRFHWMLQLEHVFLEEPFKSEGIRLYSSLLASLIYGVDRIVSCKDEYYDDYQHKEGYVQMMEELFFPAMGVLGDNVDQPQLSTTFAHCLRYSHQTGGVFTGKAISFAVGTYAIDWEDC